MEDTKHSECIPEIFVKNSSGTCGRPLLVLYNTSNKFILIMIMCNYLYKTIRKSWTCEICMIFGIHFREKNHSV